MIDSGAGPSLIKQKAIINNVIIDKTKILYLTGISKETVPTLGKLQIKFLNHDTEFYIVPNNFPIKEDGLLGVNFLSQSQARINWKDNCLEVNNKKIPFQSKETFHSIPPRSKQILYVKLENTKLKNGFIENIIVNDKLFLGNALVTNNNGFAKILAINTSNTTLKISLPPLKLHEYEILQTNKTINSHNRVANRRKRKYHKIFKISEPTNDRFDKIWTQIDTSHLLQNEKDEVKSLIKNSADCFHLKGETLPFTNLIEHRIPTTTDQPIHVKQYRFPPHLREELNKQTKDMLENGIIKHSYSPYNCPVWITPKKDTKDGKKQWRLVLDFRALNEKTIPDNHPIPNIAEILEQLGNAKYFSTFDLASGFHQIKMHPSDRHKTAFSTSFSHFEFLRMPFGLKNAPATFQRLMNIVLSGLNGTEMFVYLDDVVIHAKTLEEHRQKYLQLIDRLRQANLKLQPNKCYFLQKEVHYLGHLITEEGLKPDPKKIEAVKLFPTPRNAKNIKEFLGLAGYYRRFIHNFSKISKPLTTLLQNDKKFEWTNEQEEAFNILKDKLCSEPVLQYPNFSEKFIVTTDASQFAISGILSQGELGKDRPCAYTSRLLNNHEINYSTYEKEALAIIYSIRQFRPYLYGNKFIVQTDHKPLCWLRTTKDPTSRLTRWRLKLEEYDFEIIYKAGTLNVNADALSRNPVLNSNEQNIENIEEQEIFMLRRSSRNKTPSEKGEQYRDKIGKTKKKKLEKLEKIEEISSDEDEQETNKKEEIISQEKTESRKEIKKKNELRTNKENQSTSNDTHPQDEILMEENCYNRSSDESSEDENNDIEILQDVEMLKNIRISRDQLYMKNDNFVFFINEKGEPVDENSKNYAKKKEINKFNEIKLGEIQMSKFGKHYHFGFCIKENSNYLDTTDCSLIILNMFKKLKVLLLENNIQSFCIPKIDNVCNIQWNYIEQNLLSVFKNEQINVTICSGIVTCPPISHRHTLIQEAHESALSGHKGRSKTYARLRLNYLWENMKSDVQDFLDQCLQCKLKKLTRIKIKQSMILTDTPGDAFDKIALDITGPYPITENGNKYILTMQDLLTKYCIAVPLQNQTAASVADALIRRFICVYGSPKIILSDQGTNFLSQLLKEVAKRFKIRQVKTTAYHPQTNGSLERTHIVLVEFLTIFANSDYEWDNWVELAMFSYNTSKHESTGKTPFELIFGKIALTPSSFALPKVTNLQTYDDYYIKLATRLHNLRQEARENLIRAKEKSKFYYDKHINPKTFKPGDKVFIRKGIKLGKLGDRSDGPYKIIEILDNNRVKIKIKNEHKIICSDRLIPTAF